MPDITPGPTLDHRVTPPAGPVVSVIMANHNGAAFLDAAIGAVLKQTLTAIELILVDDGSADRSVDIMQRAAARDSRVRVFRTPANLGPAGARNIALDHAAGRWIAVVDSDDLLHPRRFEWLVAAAEADGADIAADDAMLFEEHGAFAPSAMLGRTTPEWIDPAHYIRNNALFRKGVALGYLKPIFRADTALAGGLRYNPDMRIAEDYDLVARMLIAGRRFRVYPQLTYFYRKHAGSISHRLSAAALQAMLTADDAVRLAPHSPAVKAALDSRRESIVDALDFTALIDAMKARDPKRVLAAAANPRALALLRYPVLDRLRRGKPVVAAAKQGLDVCLLTRQRVVGNTNGSSAYLLNVLETIAGQGLRLHLVCPSPVMFGRWPFLALRPEMAMFQTINVRGAVRWRNYVIARSPVIWAAAGLTVLNRLAKRARLTRADWVKPFPYAIGAPWTTPDYLYVAQHARAHGDMLVADYAFLTDGFPYALRPDAATAVVMHDLFSARVSQFAQLGGQDSVTAMTPAAEMALLSQADVVIAIQAEEAQQIRRLLPDQQVLTVPLAIHPVAEPAPGEGLEVLFVGSGTAPNVIGMKWFIDTVWPTVRSRVPGAELVICGAISHAMDRATPGIRILGQVPDLAPIYRQAAVVISPLLAGSGLKIKLVEALAHGKASVATALTLDGFPPETVDAVSVADDPAQFADAVADLLLDKGLRARRGQLGLAIAARWFSPAHSHRDLAAFAAGIAGDQQALAAE